MCLPNVGNHTCYISQTRKKVKVCLNKKYLYWQVVENYDETLLCVIGTKCMREQEVIYFLPTMAPFSYLITLLYYKLSSEYYLHYMPIVCDFKHM